MTTRRLSIARGKVSKDITEAAGAAIVTASMEFTWDRAAGLHRKDLIMALEEFTQYIKSARNLAIRD